VFDSRQNFFAVKLNHALLILLAGLWVLALVCNVMRAVTGNNAYCPSEPAGL
jgi:hypothetical protein